MDEKIEELSLRPNERIQKLLLSSPAHFVGAFDTPNLIIAHAWPPFRNGRPRRLGNDLLNENDSLGRTAFVLAFRTPEQSEPRFIIPNYEYAGEVVASALSVLFGKRFDSHGPFEMAGFFGMPETSMFSIPCDPRLRHNDGRPRADRPVALNLGEVRRIEGLLNGSSEDARVTAFHSAAKFYRRALMTFEVDPESAYLNLITAGEIIASFHATAEEQALDCKARAVLGRIENEMPDGPKITKFLRGRLRGVKRRFVNAITAMVDDSFFDRWESQDKFGSFVKDDFRTAVGAAYDLRSKFVHTGYPFGRWINSGIMGAEVQRGRPVVPDKEMAQVLARAPLFCGLERVIRYVLLTFAAKLGANVEVITERVPE